MKKMMIVSPFSRIEGDLEIRAEVEDHKIVRAYCAGSLFRGFERILKNRDPMDAIVLTCRICGICGLAHSAAASKVLRDVYGAKLPENAYHVINILLAVEHIANHITHFYMFFMPDFLSPRYEHDPLYPEIRKRFAPYVGESQKAVINARKKLLELMGFIGGKWPNSLVIQPGGVTRTLNYGEINRCLGITMEVKQFFDKVLLGTSIENWLSMRSAPDLDSWAGNELNARSDVGMFIRMCHTAGLTTLGRGSGKFLSSGGFEHFDGTFLFRKGVLNDNLLPFEESKITEHIEYSLFDGHEGGRHPIDGVTEPNASKEHAYSWSKAPRYDNEVFELGPLARMLINGDPLALDLYHMHGSSVFTRQLARIHEMIMLFSQIPQWLNEINPEHSFYDGHSKRKEGQGSGLLEAARGALGHWIHIKEGKIFNYQIVSPTTWHFSPRDSNGNPGIVEQCLNGLEIEDTENPVELYHVVRSFDPCMACTVHTTRL